MEVPEVQLNGGEGQTAETTGPEDEDDETCAFHDNDGEPPEATNCIGMKESEEDCEERQLSLFNDVVISRLMNYVNTEDLPNCRLVCKGWAGEAWRQLTRRKCISCKEDSMKQFAQFVKIIQVDNVHFSKLHFSHFSVKEYREELTEYFASAGAFVKELTLNFVDNELSLEELENVFLSSVPQLEIFALDRLPCDFFVSTHKLSGRVLKKVTGIRLNARCHYNNDEENSTLFFIDLLRLTPNLKYLHGAVDWCLPRLVKALSILKLPNLSNLILKGCFDGETARTLAMPEFKLKTLYLGITGSYDLGKSHNIIYSKRQSLRALGLGWASFMRRIDLKTVSDEYKELTCLSLCDESKWSLCGSSYTGPGLRRLLADIRNENDFTYLENRRVAFQNIHELNFSFMTYQVKNGEIVDKIATMFPALKLLTLKITNEFPISHLWSRLPGLVELTLHVNCNSFKIRVNPNLPPYMDDVLTGLGEDECERLRNNTTLLNETKLQNQSSLMNLTNLRKLTILGGQQKISHVTACLCLMNMKYLTAITLNPVNMTCAEVLQTSISPGTYLDLKC